MSVYMYYLFYSFWINKLTTTADSQTKFWLQQQWCRYLDLHTGFSQRYAKHHLASSNPQKYILVPPQRKDQTWHLSLHHSVTLNYAGQSSNFQNSRKREALHNIFLNLKTLEEITYLSPLIDLFFSHFSKCPKSKSTIHRINPYINNIILVILNIHN